MLNEILVGGGISTLGGVIGFFISKKINNANFEIYVEQAKAKAKAIESEAEIVLQKSNVKVKEIELDATRRYEDASEKAKKDLSNRDSRLLKKENDFYHFKKSEEERISSEYSAAKSKTLSLERSQKALETLKVDYQNRMNEMIHVVEGASGLTKTEAKQILLNKIEEQSRADIAHIIRRIENEAKEQAKRNANYILAQATSRFAGEFASERLINTVHLNDDELKGRIIGKEGRNIKTLEMLLGVDIIIDETPNAILISSFNLYRRSIATKTLELLIEDGRIQPARIEEIYAKVCDEFEDGILAEGEEILLNLGIHGVHPELVKLLGKLRYRASYGQNALAHTLEVAHLAGIMAAEMGGDANLTKRAGIFHDIGKALTHDSEGSHVDLGAEVCKRYSEDDVVINAIYAHHGHEEIKTVECAAVCAADSLSAARPGARREVLESFLKRVTEIEEIASHRDGVKQAYAINAGREVRVIVNATLVNDDEATLVAREIAKDIEEKVQYPGDIKVNVIRESRSIEYAR
ncbi:MAG: ribonuclease Y [Campylobacterota bacterium]|nr:ribonuclease Y [Campylobacterota bacterium]